MNHSKKFTRGFIDSQGVKIHYLIQKSQKENSPSLLFVPGIMMPAEIWEKQLEYFSKDYTVVAMDPRSQGESEQSTEGNYALQRAQDIAAVIDQLHLNSLILVGWSLAVPEVVNYAVQIAKTPLKGLVLVDGVVGIDSSLPFYASMVRLWGQFQANRIGKTAEFVRSIFKQPQPDPYLQKLIEIALKTPTNTAMALMYNYILQDFRPLLPKIKIPVLIATVEGPRLEYMKEISKIPPDCRIEIIPEAGHALFVDQPEKFNQLLESFIKSLNH